MTTLHLKKLLSLTIISLLISIVFFDFGKFSQLDFKSNYFSDYIDDEIEPLCDGVETYKLDELSNLNLELIQINLVDKEGWYKNVYELLQDRSKLITGKYKNKFEGIIEVNFTNGISCKFNAKIRLNGDVQDHIRSLNETSLDVQLMSGNIFGITKFKLFLPETRYGINEIITTSILEHLNIITPRTFQTKVIFNNSKINVYYFQEKISKELIEHNQLREGPLVLGSEEYYWEKRNKLDNNSLLVFAEIANKYWSRRSAVNEKISFKALGEYNKYIFNSLDSNNLWINSKLTYDIADPRNYEIAKFDIALISLDAQHGLALTNRILYYDNIADLFLPIYYDGDSQIADRRLFDRPDSNYLCDVFEFNEDVRQYYYRYLCVNDYKSLANEIKKNIEFTSTDVFNSVLNKGVDVEFEVIDNAYNNFIYNLNFLTLEQNEQKNKILNFNSALEKSDSFLKNTSNYGINFLFLESNNVIPKICNQYLKDCMEFPESINFFSNDFLDSNTSIHPFGNNLDEFIDTNYTLNNPTVVNEMFTIFGNLEYFIDKDKKIFKAIFEKKNQKILFFADEFFDGWTFEFESNVRFEKDFERLDENSLTGCVTFYNSTINDIKLIINNLHCEDAVNIVKTSGTINTIEIINSNSDALDVDFSNLVINNIFIANANNDCIDLSSSNITIRYSYVSDCKDKGVSVGEVANVNIEEIVVKNTKTGIAVKDSSSVVAGKVEIQNTDVCVAVYRKKQEFGPASFLAETIECESKEYFTQDGSSITLNKSS